MTAAVRGDGAGLRVGILSDTHVPSAPVLFPEILEALEGVDLILHAGDILVSSVLDELERIAPVYAAQGNHDGHLAGDPRVEPVHWLELEGHSLALLHIFEPITGDIDDLVKTFLGGVTPDIVVCGDSHVEQIIESGDVLVINAGSATLPRNRSPRPGHVGILTLSRKRPPEAALVDLGDPSWREHQVFQGARADQIDGGRSRVGRRS